jgi:hypothetical protein
MTQESPFRIGGVYRTSTGCEIEVVSWHATPLNKTLKQWPDGFVRAFWDKCLTEWRAATGELWNGDCSVGDLRPIEVVPSKLESLKAACCAEQDEIDSFRTQPAHVSHVEPEREALPHFNQRTEFDPFGPGYEVFSDAVSSGFMPAQPKAPLHPLQKMNEGGNALHGSAFLLV